MKVAGGGFEQCDNAQAVVDTETLLRFRQFLLRGLDNVRNERMLLCLARNLKRMAVLRPKAVQRAGKPP